jgi:ADP-ribosylation factor-like protein 2
MSLFLSSFVDDQALNLDTIGNRHWNIQSCSAVTGEGLVEGISWLVNDISSRIFLLD